MSVWVRWYGMLCTHGTSSRPTHFIMVSTGVGTLTAEVEVVVVGLAFVSRGWAMVGGEGRWAEQ